jgi:predicted short-subunit dehydrogenase-like oxidoreductase (DUF2520 family)
MLISLIGSGNVATQLGIGLYEAGNKFSHVFSRELSRANELAEKLQATPTNNLNAIAQESDLILVCVTDKFIQEVTNFLTFEPKLIAHTSGSMPISVLSKFKNRGVFYPLQTFTKGRFISLRPVPICIEAAGTSNKNALTELASQLSDRVIEMDSSERKQCHLAAVFANNFTNHMYAIAEQLLHEKNIPFHLLQPLIKETAEKIQQMSPANAQTGPAVRNDIVVMKEHLKQLESDKLEKLYSFVSNSIRELSESKKSK